VTQGQLSKGYKLIHINTNPEYVSLEGGTTFFNRVSAVKVFVDLSGIDYDLTLVKDFRLFDRAGNEIDYNNKKIPISISLEVAKVVKIIPLISGKPDNDFIEDLRETNPKEVYIKGPKEIVDSIDEIKTEIYNIDGIKENLSTKVKLQIPSNIKIIDNKTEVDMDIKLKIKSDKNNVGMGDM
jgi:YbbR domain-containing protein